MFTSITRLTVFWSSTCNRVAVLQSPSQIFFWQCQCICRHWLFSIVVFFDHEARHLLSCVKITGVTSPWPSFKIGLINLVSLLTYTSDCGNNSFSVIDHLKANEVLCLVWTIRKQDEINYRKLRVKGRGGKQAWWPRTFGESHGSLYWSVFKRKIEVCRPLGVLLSYSFDCLPLVIS